MDPTYSPEAEAYREKVRAFLGEHLPADWKGTGALGDEERERFVTEWRALLAGNGLLAPAWPVEYGGGGLSGIERVVLSEEFAKAGVPTGGPTDIFGIGMLGPTLMALGTEDQKSYFLPRIISGEHRWCQGYSEPDAGSDLANLGTRADLDGDEWVINGQKIWTSEGHLANWIFVLCRTDPSVPKHQGISFLLVPMDQPGIEVRPIVNMAHRADFNEVFFTDVRTRRDLVLGEVNGGWMVANALLGFERGGAATTVALQYREELDRLLGAARQLGRTGDPLLRQRLAWAHSKVEIMRFLGMRSLSQVLAGQNPGPESSIIKLLHSEYHLKVTELALDLIGTAATAPSGRPAAEVIGTDAVGSPYSSRGWVETFLGARPGTIYAGTSQIQRNIIGERVLGLPKEPRADTGPFRVPAGARA